MNRIAALFLVALPALALGCQVREPTSPDEGLGQVHPPQPPDLGREPPRVEVDMMYNMYVNENVRSACAGPDPFFSFASGKPTEHDDATMRVLATCMNTGALRDKSILLVGRTDPRGSETYNEKLGLARAEKVKAFLVSHGVDEKRVRTASLGKDDASPAPANWASDRRVEVRLAN